MLELTDTEEKELRALRKALKRASKHFTLFSASGTLHILKGKNGKKYSIGTAHIDNDGGDPDWNEDEDGYYIYYDERKGG